MNGSLKRAIEGKQSVQMIYLDHCQKFTQRVVLPYEIKGHHLHAHCFLRNQYRLFNLDNILSVFPTKSQKYPKSG